MKCCKKIGWDTLENRRKIARLCLMYKFFHKDSKIDVEDIILKPCYIGRNDHSKKIRRIQSRLLPYHNSFFPKTIREWNTLSDGIVQAATIGDFKKMLHHSE